MTTGSSDLTLLSQVKLNGRLDIFGVRLMCLGCCFRLFEGESVRQWLIELTVRCSFESRSSLLCRKAMLLKKQ
jgi:hypothetical protein